MPASAYRHFSRPAVLATSEVASTIVGLVKQRTATPVFSGLSRIEPFATRNDLARDASQGTLVLRALRKQSQMGSRAACRARFAVRRE